MVHLGVGVALAAAAGVAVGSVVDCLAGADWAEEVVEEVGVGVAAGVAGVLEVVAMVWVARAALAGHGAPRRSPV